MSATRSNLPVTVSPHSVAASPVKAKSVGSQRVSVFRLLPGDEVDTLSESELGPLAQALASSRSMVLARLATLRLMQKNSAMRESLSAVTVEYAHQALFIEEEIIERLDRGVKSGISSGPVYCMLHMRLDDLLSFSENSANGSVFNRWVMLVSEVILGVQECATYVQSVLAKATTTNVNVDDLAGVYREIVSSFEQVKPQG